MSSDADLMQPTYVTTVSFDVFDTVLVRNLHRPRDIHARVWSKLVADDKRSATSYVQSRISAEHIARMAHTGSEEITLEEIMVALQQHTGMTAEEISAIKDGEINVEVCSVVPVQPVLSIIRKARQSGKRIVFLSDMYLPDRTIMNMLKRVGALEHGDRIYVSGSIGKKKSTGALYRHVMDDLGLQPSQLVHMGDYLWSDYLVPRWKHTIAACLVRDARSNVYERLWGDQCSCQYCSTVAGAMRAGRVAQTTEEVGTNNAPYNVGCNVVGPILTAFIFWALQHAASQGIQRIYFLSRDGEIMLETAHKLAKRFEHSLDLRYLHVSRTAVFPAMAATAVDSRSISWIKEDNIALTLRILADRIRIDVNELHRAAQRNNIHVKGPDAALTGDERDTIYRLFLSDPALHDLVTESGKTARSVLFGYLEQEGFFDESDVAFVDLGWHGSIQDVICSCFSDRIGNKIITGYYLGVDHTEEVKCRKFGYLFDHSGSAIPAQYHHIFRVLMELLCSGRQGMVSGYHGDADKGYKPIFKEIEHPLNSGRVEQIRKGVNTFLNNADMSEMISGDYEHVRPHILDLLCKLYFYPSRMESLALGDMRFSADQAGHGVRSFAPPFKVLSSIRYLMGRSYADRSIHSSWFFGSWARSAWVIRAALYPLVLSLRAYFVGSKILRFNMLMIIDRVNRLITEKRGPHS